MKAGESKMDRIMLPIFLFVFVALELHLCYKLNITGVRTSKYFGKRPHRCLVDRPSRRRILHSSIRLRRRGKQCTMHSCV